VQIAGRVAEVGIAAEFEDCAGAVGVVGEDVGFAEGEGLGYRGVVELRSVSTDFPP
jgi:hypothetical protein